MRRTAPLLGALLGATMLAGCTAGGGTATTSTVTTTETVTTTATVTATPSPVARSWDDPITAFDAWTLCWGATYGQYSDTSTVYPYLPEAPGGTTVTDRGDGTFEVRVAFAASNGVGPGNETICDVGGTVGNPVILGVGAHDFG